MVSSGNGEEEEVVTMSDEEEEGSSEYEESGSEPQKGKTKPKPPGELRDGVVVLFNMCC